MRQSLSLRLGCVGILGLFLVACSSQETAMPAPDPVAELQAVPPADPGKYERIVDMRNWRNPYLLLRTDGVAIFDPADHAEILLKPGEILAGLARQPASAWPYGRVVAISENEKRSSEQDAVAVRRMKGIVGGVLEGAHVVIRWIPSA